MGHATRPRRRDGRTRLTIYGLPLALMAVAAVWRLWLLGHVYTNVDSDQAIIGVMAYHIQAGHHPLMYAGQPYQGSLEAYAAALLFALCGASDWTLRLPVLACAVLFVGAVYALGATLYGRRVAAISAVVVALGPGALLYYGDVTGFGYSEVMLLGTLLLVLQARHPDPRAMPLRVALVMGLVAGLGAWIEPLMAEYLLPLGLAYARPLLTIRRGPCARMAPARPLAAIALGAIVGGAPLLAYNLRHHWATLSYLVAQGGQRVDHLGAVTRLMTESLPVLLGLAVPNSNHGAFISLSARYPVQRAVGVAAGLYLLGRFVPALPRRIAALLTDQTVADGSSSRQEAPRRRPGPLRGEWSALLHGHTLRRRRLGHRHRALSLAPVYGHAAGRRPPRAAPAYPARDRGDSAHPGRAGGDKHGAGAGDPAGSRAARPGGRPDPRAGGARGAGRLHQLLDQLPAHVRVARARVGHPGQRFAAGARTHVGRPRRRGSHTGPRPGLGLRRRRARRAELPTAAAPDADARGSHPLGQSGHLRPPLAPRARR